MLDYENVQTNETTFLITGTGEAGTNVIVNNFDTGDDVDQYGDFETEVDLTGGGTEDTFSVALMDDGYNLSPGEKVYITSSAESANDDDDDNDDPVADDDDDDDNDDSTSTSNFTDTPGHWAKGYIDELYNSGAINGYGDGQFGPDDPVTRAQVVKIALGALAQEDFNEDADHLNHFSDVAASAWHSAYVEEAYRMEIVEGYDDRTYRPDNEVTRAAALKIILETAGIEADSTGSNFNDVSDTDWYADYTAFAKDAGIIGGYADGSFKGAQSITRAEVCKIVSLVIDYIAD